MTIIVFWFFSFRFISSYFEHARLSFMTVGVYLSIHCDVPQKSCEDMFEHEGRSWLSLKIITIFLYLTRSTVQCALKTNRHSVARKSEKSRGLFHTTSH